MINRAAHHAKDIKKLYKELTSVGTDKKSAGGGMSGEEFMNALMGALGKGTG